MLASAEHLKGHAESRRKVRPRSLVPRSLFVHSCVTTATHNSLKSHTATNHCCAHAGACARSPVPQLCAHRCRQSQRYLPPVRAAQLFSAAAGAPPRRTCTPALSAAGLSTNRGGRGGWSVCMLVVVVLAVLAVLGPSASLAAVDSGRIGVSCLRTNCIYSIHSNAHAAPQRQRQRRVRRLFVCGERSYGRM